MALFKLTRALGETSAFADAPELDMGVQLGIDESLGPELSPNILRAAESSQFYLVIGSRVAVSFDEELGGQLRDLQTRLWMAAHVDNPKPDAHDPRIDDFVDWYEKLPYRELIPPTVPDIRESPAAYYATIARARFILSTVLLGPAGPLPPVPPRPAYVYGHLPFHGVTGLDDVFYRFESFPTSVRIDQNKGRIVKDTYAAPSSEAPFAPTGFGAVARFALPTLWPARWRWEIQPLALTPVKMGASVPLNGQSGGGVEVMFVNDVQNRGPIANPYVLPIL
jgi:hypothetical protein